MKKPNMKKTVQGSVTTATLHNPNAGPAPAATPSCKSDRTLPNIGISKWLLAGRWLVAGRQLAGDAFVVIAHGCVHYCSIRFSFFCWRTCSKRLWNTRGPHNKLCGLVYADREKCCTTGGAEQRCPTCFFLLLKFALNYRTYHQ